MYSAFHNIQGLSTNRGLLYHGKNNLHLYSSFCSTNHSKFFFTSKIVSIFFFFRSYFINGDMWWCLSCNKCTYCKQFPKCKFKVLYNPCNMPACSPGVIQPFLSKVPYGMFRFSYSNTLTHQWKYNGIYSYHVQRHFDIQLEQGMEPLTF